MLLEFAELHGIREDVAGLIAKRPALRVPSLHMLLRHQRRRRGMTIDDVRARIPLSRSQLSGYEGASAENPGLRTVQALAYGYRLPFWLVLCAAYKKAHRVRG